jgi:hypothetical protein
VVSPDVGAVEKGHAKRDAVLLDEIEQALPDALLRPANEELRRQPPRTQFGRDAAPLRAILVPPENRRDCPPQFLRWRLAARPDLFDQRLPYRPRHVRQNLTSTPICHPPNIGTVIKI